MKIDWIKLHVGLGFTLVTGAALFFAAELLRDASTIPETCFIFLITTWIILDMVRNLKAIGESIQFEGKRKGDKK